ncbi:MAG: hypothetical protein COA78_38695 [Blastopirellula sp.]|nr:MAG: hypothetical protein COA78_38695 [Blastopirellula sp.]
MSDSKKISWIAAPIIILVVLVVYWIFTPKYGETSDKAYEFAVAIFSTCNQQDEARLKEISTMIDSAISDGEIQREEAKWLTAIIDNGLAGNWDKASADVRQLMKDQVQAASPLPEV